jgi:DNA transposition AAA+ family ATPase
MSTHAQEIAVAATAATPQTPAPLRIAGDVVNRATADLPDDQRNAIRWLHGHGLEAGMTLDELAATVNYDKNTLYQVFTGRHGAGKAAITTAIERYRKLSEAREGIGKLAFIETELTKRIFALVHAARAYQRAVFIFSDSQIGKTTALTEYTKQNNHGSTVYVSMPAGGNMGDFMRVIARALHIPTRTSLGELRDRIVSAFDNRMVLIVDEAHQCFLRAGLRPRGTAHLLALEFVREIFDRSNCGLVICGTNTFKAEMDAGFASGWLTQLSRRRLVSLQIKPTPSTADLNAFSAAYGLAPASEDALALQARVVSEEALGVWLTLLRMAAGIASKSKQTLAWKHVLRAYEARNRLGV